VAQSLRQPCPRPPADFATFGDLGAFAIKQEAALSVCEAMKTALVQTIDVHNAAVSQLAAKPPRRKWWPW
jgi:hypothetical protein